MKRHGNAAITVALFLTVLLMFAALAIDIGAHRVHRQKAHLAAEAAAHAGASQLDGTDAGMAAARTIAEQVGEANDIAGYPVVLEPSDIILGYIDGNGNFVAGGTAQTTTSVRVDATGQDIPTFFAGAVFATSTLDASESAIAVGGGPRQAECPFPIALPSCALPPAGICGLEIQMSGGSTDNAAWAIPGTTNPSASELQTAMTTCSAASSTMDVLALNNGQATVVLGTVIDYMWTNGEPWSEAEFGPLPAQDPDSEVPVAQYGTVARRMGMVFDQGTCGGPYTQDGVPVLGYVTLVIYDVSSHAPGDKWIRMRVACDEADERSGGGFYGTTSPPRFVSP